MIRNSIRKFNRNTFKSLIRIVPKNPMFLQKYNFTNNKVEHEEEDTHSDFKPQSKQKITDENVLNVIDDWVKSNKVCLFMKGVPQMPQCGFSNYVVQVLKFYNIKDYKAVNILENNILREAVKKYSNWPTYPQLYVNSSLVGKVINKIRGL